MFIPFNICGLGQAIGQIYFRANSFSTVGDSLVFFLYVPIRIEKETINCPAEFL